MFTGPQAHLSISADGIYCTICVFISGVLQIRLHMRHSNLSFPGRYKKPLTRYDVLKILFWVAHM